MKKTISIIVPIYNVEHYLRRCLLSIVSQNVSVLDYELICVNDGSTDGSRAILSELQKEYPCIQVVDKENGGLSSARNAGLLKATGDFIFFVDSDDWIADNSLSFLLKQINDKDIDILLFSACEIDDRGKVNFLTSSLAPANEILTIEEYLNNFTLRSSACLGIFSRHLFVEYDLSMKLNFFAEDDDFIVRIFSVAQTLVCVAETVYYYYQRPDSISKNKNKAHQEKLVYDKLAIIKDLKSHVEHFDGKMRLGLDRKMNFLAVDLIRFLIRQQHSNIVIKDNLAQLCDAGYYPLPQISYSFKYRVFAFLLSNPLVVKFLARIGFLRFLF